MTENPTYTEIAKSLGEEKLRLGGLEIVEIRASSMEEAHEMLGHEVSDKAMEVLRGKIDGYSNYEDFQAEMEAMSIVYYEMIAKINSPETLELIREGLKEYLACLDARSRGMGIDTLENPFLEKYRVENENGDDAMVYRLVGLMSQNDNVGCQSGMVRKGNKIMLWHTEEDYEEEKGQRMDKPRLVKFDINGEIKYSFIYPNLMPGPAFSFGNNFFYSVDFNYVKENEDPSILANIGVWVAWRLTNRIPPEEVIKNLSPFMDGYTLNYIWRSRDEEDFEAGKVEFGHGLTETYDLSDEPLISVNKFDESSPLTEIEEIDDEEKALYDKRKSRARRATNLIESMTKEGIGALENLRRMTGFRSRQHGGEAGMAVDFTKAHLVAEITKEGLYILVGAGPTIKDEELAIFDLRKEKV